MKTIAVYYNATIRQEYGGETRNDVELFRDLLSPYLPDCEFVTIDSANGHFPDDPTQFDGVILGGSAAYVTNAEPWMERLFEQIRELDKARIPLWGICFGHQAVAVALGGKVEDRPLSLGAPTVEILDPEPWMHPYLPTFKLYAGNFQQVVHAPDGMRRIAIGRGNRLAMLAKDDHIVTLQFHPEFPHIFMEAYADELFANHQIGTRQYQEAKREILAGSDADLMAKWMARFFQLNWAKPIPLQQDLRIVATNG